MQFHLTKKDWYFNIILFGGLVFLFFTACHILTPPQVIYIYTSHITDQRIMGFRLNRDKGSLTPILPLIFPPTSNGPESLVLHPTLPFAFAPASGGTSAIYRMGVSARNGTMVELIGSPFFIPETPNKAEIHPSGKYLYSVNINASISQLSINPVDASLTSIAPTETTQPGGGWRIGMDPLGEFLYVSSPTSNTLSHYSINISNGALTRINPDTNIGGSPRGIVFHPNGRWIYVARAGLDNIGVYSVDRMTKLPTNIGFTPAGTGPFSLAVEPEGRYLYAANRTSGNISAYQIDPSSGNLSELAGSPFPAGDDPFVMDIDAAGLFLYVGNFADFMTSFDVTLRVYSIDNITGTLTNVASVLTTERISAVKAHLISIQN